MKRKAFTMIELLISLPLVALLMVTLWQLIDIYTNLSKRECSYSTQTTNVSVIIDKLEEDLQKLPSRQTNIKKKVYEETGIIVKEELEAFEIAFEEIVNPRVISEESLPEEIPEKTKPAITKLVGDTKSLTLPDIKYLIKKEFSRTETKDGQESSFSIKNISDANFRYFDGEEWRETWNSIETGDLPEAIEMNIKLSENNSQIRQIIIVRLI